MKCELRDVNIGSELPEDCGLVARSFTIQKTNQETTVSTSNPYCRQCGSHALQGASLETDPYRPLHSGLDSQIPLAKRKLAELIEHCPRTDLQTEDTK